MVDSSAWVSRLERRVSKLADTASKESIQALAKWIGFNRKHVKAFSKALADAIADPSKTGGTNGNKAVRQWLYLQIIHESIILDSGTSRWERFSEMREILGEDGMVEVAKMGCLDSATVKKVEGLIKQWDTLNVFGGPSILKQIKKQLTSPSNKETTTTTTKQSPEKATESATTADPQPKPEEADTKQSSTPPKAKSPKRDRDGSPKKPESIATNEDAVEKMDVTTPSSPKGKVAAKSEQTPPKATKKEVEYDFESKNIPYGKVDSREFLAPCKAIATLQIARDMRNDSAVQLSSLLKALPDEVKEMCDEADKQVKETGKPYQLSEQKAREFSLKTSEKLLDMDLEEQVQNVRTFLEIVEKQREARERLIYLLVRSRCQFGANEAAEEFYNLDDTMDQLQKVKDTLQDGMALEGLDFEQMPSPKKSKTEVELEPLTWYSNREGMEGEPEAKKLKLND